jgi:peptide/nickel transport system permease protein
MTPQPTPKQVPVVPQSSTGDSVAVVSSRAADQLLGAGPRVHNVTRRLSRVRHVVAAFILLCGMLWIAIFAEFFVGDAPLLGSMRTKSGETHFVILANVVNYDWYDALSETEQIEARRTATGVFPLFRASPQARTSSKLLAPFTSHQHVLGTDTLGRDVLAGVVYGLRDVVTSATAAAVLLVGIGAVLGALSGYFGGKLDSVIMRLAQVMSAFPTLVLAVLTQALLQTPTTATFVISVVVTRWTDVARVVRGEVLRAQSEDYVLASRALGASPLRALWVHVAPHARAQALVAGAFALSNVVLIDAACDFLGYGLQQSRPSWGELMAQVRTEPSAYWLLLAPASALLVLLLCQNLVADALREGLDPRKVHSTLAS